MTFISPKNRGGGGFLGIIIGGLQKQKPMLFLRGF